MNITPVIPDGYNGPIKQLTCRICKHLFYLTMADYSRLAGVSYCHECSLILAEELEKAHGMPSRMPPQQAPVPPSYSSTPAFVPAPPPPAPTLASPQPSIRVPQSRTIDRHKMTVEQLLEEARMLSKTWRYQEALISSEEALQRDPGCLEALYGKGKMLSHLNRPKEELAVYEEILHLDPTAVKACVKKGWALTVLRRYEEALATFDHALQLEPSSERARGGKRFIFIHLDRDQEYEELADPEAEKAAWEKIVAQPCHSAEE